MFVGQLVPIHAKLICNQTLNWNRAEVRRKPTEWLQKKNTCFFVRGDTSRNVTKSSNPVLALQKAGLAPTGILANAAKALGFASVDALLKVNPEAAQSTQAAKEAAREAKTAAKEAAKQGKEAAKNATQESAVQVSFANQHLVTSTC